MLEPLTVGAMVIISMMFGFIVLLGIAAIHSMEKRIKALEEWKGNHEETDKDKRYILSNKDVQDIRELSNRGLSKTQIAIMYGVSRQTLYNALKR